MERFKATEKEMKTKAYSKEGLSAAVKLDPNEVLKEEMSNFISETVTELGRQVEVAEAEVESLQGGAKKKRGGPAADRINEVEALNERRRWHVGRLELILRLLENGQIPPNKVSDIQTDVKYFLESNTEEDFVEDEGIYDDLDLDRQDEQFGIVADDMLSSHDTSSVVDPSDVTPPVPKTPAKEPKKPVVEEAEKSPAAKKPAPSTPVAPTTTARKATLDGTVPRPTIAQIKGTPTPAPAAPAPRTVVPMQPVRYSVAAAGAVATTAPTSSIPAAASSVTSPPAVPPATAAPGGPTASAPTPIPIATSNVTSPRGSDIVPPSPIRATAVPPIPSTASPAPSSGSVVSAPQPAQTATNSNTSPASVIAPLPSPPPASMTSTAAPDASRPTSTKPESAVSPSPSAPRSALSDLLTTFESAKSKAQRGGQDLNVIHEVLDAGYSNIPQPQDAERPRHYAPKQPYPTPAYYPQQPQTSLENPAMFGKLDLDTLFYIFYYQPGTYAQYLAAQELKNKSWRFHTSYLTWFQRAQEPDVITDEYEQGVYHYFGA